MRKLLLSIIVCALAQVSFAQPVVKGKVSDTLEKRNLQNAVVSILKRSDSTLVQFTRTVKSGEFQISNVDSGKYILLITYPGFADYADYFDVKYQTETNVGSISLTLKSKLMDAVIIKSAGAIRIKGDTTEFVADSFHVKEGATVEDLLKKFPGFTVNSKGQITAQGKRVDKVLVDGEEFFGDDPTMVTQNLSSKAVDKVQVFDSKTDEQNLTGISNTQSNTKTLNIKLKSDYKKGSFGRVEAASDFNRYHDAKLLYNHFKGVQKFSLYGTKSTTTTGSLSWQDQNKLGVDNTEYGEVEGGIVFFSQQDEFSNWSLQGLPDAYTLGSVYINKWNSDKQTINGSMKYNYLGTFNSSSTFTKSILPNSVLISQKNANGRGTVQQYAPTIKYEWKPDSATTITFKSNNSYKTNKLTNYTNSETDLEDLTPLNKSNRINNNNGTKRKTDNLLSYKRTFKNPREQVTASLHYTYNNDDEDNFTNSENYYYTNGSLTSKDTINQEKKIRSNSSTAGANISWTKPLSKDWSFTALGSYSKNTSDGYLNTFDRSVTGKYDFFSPYYSNNFNYGVSASGGTAVVKYETKKINFSLGSGVSDLKQQVYNIDSSKRNNYTFFKVLPQVQFRYTIKPQTGFFIGYRGSSQQPGIEQLQPLRNNNDPLNVYVGNPGLKIGFNNNFSMNYYSFKTLSQRYFYSYFNYAAITNAVTSSSNVDAYGRKVSTNVNTNGNKNWALYSWWQKSGEGKWNPNFGLDATGGTSVAFVNGQKNINDYKQYDLSLRINKNKEGKYDVGIGPHFGQSFSSSSLQPENKTRYITWGGNIDANINFLKKFEINTDFDAQLRQKISAADRNTNVILWNARLTRKLLKKDVARISFIAHDILNQNKGVNRIINSNFLVDERYLKVPRYFQLKLEWTFNTNQGTK